MPSCTVELTIEQEAFVEGLIKAGAYRDADEALRDAIRVLQSRHAMEDLRLQLLRTHVAAGVAALDRGEFVEIDDTELEDALDPTKAPGAN